MQLLLPVYLPTLLIAISDGMMATVLPLYARGAGFSYGLVGVILAGEAIGMLLTDIPAGTLLRRIDRKVVMIAGGLALAVTAAALVLTEAAWGMLVLRVLAGVGAGLFNVSRHAYLAENASSHGRGRAIAIFGGVNRIGVFVGPLLAGTVASRAGLSLPFALCAGFSVASVISVIVFARRGESEHSPNDSTRESARRHLAKVAYDNRTLLATAGLAQLCAQGVRAGRKVVIPLVASSVLELDVAAVGWILSLSALVDMSLFYPAGWLMDNFGRKYAIVPCFLIQSIGMLLVPLSTGFGTLLAAACLIGFGNGLGSGTMMTLGADLAPKASLGEFLGVWRLIGDGGGVISPLIIGTIADALTLGAGTIVIACVGLVGTSLFAFSVPETNRRTPASVP
ncbi:MAG: MFS transporter [Deinococcota bacterium]